MKQLILGELVTLATLALVMGLERIEAMPLSEGAKQSIRAGDIIEGYASPTGDNCNECREFSWGVWIECADSQQSSECIPTSGLECCEEDDFHCTGLTFFFGDDWCDNVIEELGYANCANWNNVTVTVAENVSCP